RLSAPGSMPCTASISSFFYLDQPCESFFFFFSSRRRHTRCLSDWSSDVCSSDLSVCRRPPRAPSPPRAPPSSDAPPVPAAARKQIGRASCRERVEISGGAVPLKKKNEGADRRKASSRSS